MTDEHARCLLQNQIEIIGALLLLLRYAKPDLVGGGGELDRQLSDLIERYKVTKHVLHSRID